jgi:hypothetical protein
MTISKKMAWTVAAVIALVFAHKVGLAIDTGAFWLGVADAVGLLAAIRLWLFVWQKPRDVSTLAKIVAVGLGLGTVQFLVQHLTGIGPGSR